METASFMLVLNKQQSSVPKKGVTPPELKIYQYLHTANVGGPVVAQIPVGRDGAWQITGEKKVITGRISEVDPKTGKEISVTNSRPIKQAEERSLLVRKFGGKAVDAVFPANTALPEKFSDIGVNADGTSQPAAQAETIEIEGEEAIIVAPSEFAVAPKSDGVSVGQDTFVAGEFREGSPDHLVGAAGPLRDDGGRVAA